jgi:hypothetical protein
VNPNSNATVAATQVPASSTLHRARFDRDHDVRHERTGRQGRLTSDQRRISVLREAHEEEKSHTPAFHPRRWSERFVTGDVAVTRMVPEQMKYLQKHKTDYEAFTAATLSKPEHRWQTKPESGEARAYDPVPSVVR